MSLYIAGKPLSCLDFCSLFDPSVNQRRGRHGRHGLSLRCRVSRPDQAIGDVHIYVRSTVAFWISLPGCLNHRNNNRSVRKEESLIPEVDAFSSPITKRKGRTVGDQRQSVTLDTITEHDIRANRDIFYRRSWHLVYFPSHGLISGDESGVSLCWNVNTLADRGAFFPPPWGWGSFRQRAELICLIRTLGEHN